MKKLYKPWIFSFLAMLLSGLSSSQATELPDEKGILDHKVNFSFYEVSLEKVLDHIALATEIEFLYSPQRIQSDRKVSVNADNESLGTLLNRLLARLNIGYELVNGTNQILLFRQERVARLTTYTRKIDSRSLNLHPRERPLSGTVTDVNGDPLVGVNIVLKNNPGMGTVTDFDGKYSLEIPEDTETLVFSYIGYKSQEIMVTDQTVVDVVLQENISRLDEVVVVGYGTVKKSDLTGSVHRLDGESFQNQPMTQLSEMLTGTVAGFNANQGTTAAGGSSLEIRGATSLNAETEPLIVLDGVIFNGSINDIAPNDVKSIDILKDASSAAVYGSRAASGVVIITTKKGISGKPTINFSTDIGMAQVTNNNIRPLTEEEYTNFRRDLLIKENPNQPDYYFHNPENLPSDISVDEWINFNDNPNSDVTTEWLNRLFFFPTEVESYLSGETIDWQDRMISQGLRQNYDLSVNGGTDQLSYYWSMGYTNNEGIVVGDDFATLRSRLNVNAKITDFLEAGINAQFSNRDNSAIMSTTNQMRNSLNQMLISSPYSSMYEVDGSVKWFPNDYIGVPNPLINNLLQDRSTRSNALFSSIYANVKLPFDINYKLSFQPRFVFLSDYNFWPSSTPTGSNVQGRGTRRDSKTYEWMLDNLLTWNKTFGIHKLDLTFLFNLEKFQSWRSDQSGEGFAPNENLSFNAIQFATNLALSNTDNYATGDALMGRINYTLDEKYLFTFSMRRDGYSAFGQGNPRAIFPAGAFAWKISDESFFNLNFLSQLKLRLSWGVNGNREIGRYAALAQLEQNIYSNGSSVLVGVFNNSLANPNLAWERTEAFNVGLDFGLKDGRINGSIDVYDMTTNDLLMERNLPRITGFDDITTNLGELQNRGFELTVNSVNIDNPNFQWNSNLVFSLNRNKIIRLFGDFEEVEINGETIRREVSDISNGWFIGEAIDRVWDYNIAGVWQTNEIDEADVYGLTPGDYKAEDVNGDGVYSQLEDKQFIGWRQPRYRIGLGNSFTVFQNFTASVFLRSELGHMGSIDDFKHESSNLYDRRGMRSVPYWTEASPSNRYGSLTASSAYGGGYGIYFDRSFLRIQDLSLAYKVPEEVYQRMSLTNLRLYVSVRNLYSFNKWEHWDPESYDPDTGNSTPMPRIFTVGLNMSL